MSIREMDLHGHTVSYRYEGKGPVLLLVHGIAGSKETWDHVVKSLAKRHTVIAPDLPGHGDSGASAGDYSIGAMAATLRDLLLTLGHERATLVGHSLGGGIAMQFSYLFPEHTDRLVLVSSGGLGRSVNPLLRSAALPGSEVVVAGIGFGARAAGLVVGPVTERLGLFGEDTREIGRAVTRLSRRDTRAAFLSTLRAVVGFTGQRVFAGDRLYLAERMPTLIIWGENDLVIPVGHGRRAHDAMPGSELVVLPGVGHMPPLEAPTAVANTIKAFLGRREPASVDPDRWRDLLRQGGTVAIAG